MKRSRRRSSFPLTLGLAVALAWPALAGAEDAQKPAAQPTPEKKASISDSPYSGGPPPITGGHTDTWQGGKKTSGAIPPGLVGGGAGAGKTDGEAK